MAVLGWMYMSDMPQHGNKPFLQRVFYYASLNGQAYACSAIAYGVAMGTFRSALMDTPTGIANGSTFKQISAIFLNIGQPEQAGPVLGWSSAIASYGAAIIPGVLGVAVTQKNVPNNMYGFAGYYITCFILNFWCYLRPGADTRC